ncbi:hypothetical protein DBR06_SOUSAS116110001, partial [Sousa chinensis]
SPCTIRGNKRGVRWQSEGHMHTTVWRNRKPLEREMGENTQDGTPGSWFRVTVSILAQTHLSFFQSPVPLAPDFPATTRASERLSPSLSPQLTLSKRFDVSQQALDLQRLRLDPDLVGYDIDIFLNRRSCMAATLQVIEKYFPELLSLNLSNNKLYQLDGLSDIIQMAPTVKILNLSKNELTSVWELSKMQGLKLEELWLQGNPLCDTFPDQSTYVRSV